MQTSLCRACLNACPTLVEVEDGRLVRVTGDPENEVFRGYTCVKGRKQPDLLHHPARLRHSLKRTADGWQTISSTAAMDEIAATLMEITDRHGPRAVAGYFGTAVSSNFASALFVNAFLHALGSPMEFNPNTIDKPGKSLAYALLGAWMAPLQGYDRPEAALVLGANPFKSYYGTACGNPATWLSERLAAGMELIVVDPRRSDLAKRATLHLQPRPGQDIAILACIIRTILEEGLHDGPFVEESTTGLDDLRRAVAPFTPAVTAARADVAADDLVWAARSFAGAGRGYAVCGVGPGFSDSSTLAEYLVLVLETLCGHWLRAGEVVTRAPTLMPARAYKAQPSGPRPAWGVGPQLRVHDLVPTVAGMPTGVLADEILLEGKGQVRALLSVAGNPLSAWPDQGKVAEALGSLDLLVQIDPWMSATARLAHYVIAPRMAYEMPGTTLATDACISLPTHYGPAESYAQYTPALVEPPAGSDVIADWELLYGVAQRMGLSLSLRSFALSEDGSLLRIPLDMSHTPNAEEIVEIICTGSRVPLAEVKRHPHGATFPDRDLVVQPADPGLDRRMDLANGPMLHVLGSALERRSDPVDRPFRLIGHRVQHMVNSTVNDVVVNRGRGHNPALLNPEDLAALGLSEGDVVEITSRQGRILAMVAPDPSLRRGLVSMAHGYGDLPERDGEFETIGSPVGRLLAIDDFADAIVGMPRIGNVPVTIGKP